MFKRVRIASIGLQSVLLLLCLFGSLAIAQSTEDVATLYADADVVFTGFVEELQPSSGGFTISFKIDQTIKGRLSVDKILQLEFPSSSPCSGFKEHHSYLVYGRKVGGTFWADLCGSKLISLAEPDLRYIHTVNLQVTEQCSAKRLAKLAVKSPIIATAEVVGTEDSLGTSTALFRPWCGLTLSTEDAYYNIREVLKGQIADSKIVVEHLICSDTITVDGYHANLSPTLFKTGNVILLFLKAGSHQPDKQAPPPFKSIYEDLDENCGAVIADDEAARDVSSFVRGKY
jgi:hypothetical protein